MSAVDYGIFGISGALINFPQWATSGPALQVKPRGPRQARQTLSVSGLSARLCRRPASGSGSHFSGQRVILSLPSSNRSKRLSAKQEAHCSWAHARRRRKIRGGFGVWISFERTIGAFEGTLAADLNQSATAVSGCGCDARVFRRRTRYTACYRRTVLSETRPRRGLTASQLCQRLRTVYFLLTKGDQLQCHVSSNSPTRVQLSMVH